MFIFATILLISSISAIEMDLCLPNFPEIQAIFNLTPFKVELLLSINILAHCLSAFFIGNLGDKYGKKTIIIYGLICFVLSSFLCYIANSYEVLLLGRIIQGIAVAPAAVLTPIIIIDLYSKEKREKMMNILNGVSALILCLSPSIGSYVALFFQWRANFLLLIIIGIIGIMFALLFLPNSTKKDHLSISLNQYLEIFQNKQAVLLLISLSMSIASYYTFVGMESLIYIKSFGVSLKSFGFYQGYLAIMFGIVSIFSDKIIKIFNKNNTLIVSAILVIFSYLFQTMLVIYNIKNPLIITIAMSLKSVGVAIPINILYIKMLQIIPNASGKISALITISKFIFTIFGIQIASYFYTNDFRSTGITVLIMDLISLILLVKFYLNLKESNQG